ncbi:MAG: hypothetical protein R3B13_07790 [Polyangiaceae bacterium]
MARRNRRRERGAAAVEGAVTATLFVLIFAGLWASLGFFRTKLDVMQTARQEAWQKALDPCGGSGLLGGVKESLLGEISKEDSSGSEDKFGDFEGSLDESGGYVTSNIEGSHTNSALFGGGTNKPVGKMYVRCNEDVSKEGLSDIVGEAFGIAKGLIF